MSHEHWNYLFLVNVLYSHLTVQLSTASIISGDSELVKVVKLILNSTEVNAKFKACLYFHFVFPVVIYRHVKEMFINTDVHLGMLCF